MNDLPSMKTRISKMIRIVLVRLKMCPELSSRGGSRFSVPFILPHSVNQVHFTCVTVVIYHVLVSGIFVVGY